MTSQRIRRVLVTGAGGQLGRALQAAAPSAWEVVALDSRMLDITLRDEVDATFRRVQPTLVLNAAAFTNVDAAETDSERAHAVNAQGPANLAIASAMHGARMVHVSTDFVFDGTSATPYEINDAVNPISVYGSTKHEGDQAVLSLAPGGAVVRTAWVYGGAGVNFVTRMLALMAERSSLKVVKDQVGSPTWTRSLALALWRVAEMPTITGTHHWVDAGAVSRFEFAVAIMNEAIHLGLLSRPLELIPVSTAEYHTLAARPAYSVLSTKYTSHVIGLVPDHWRENLRRALGEIAHA